MILGSLIEDMEDMVILSVKKTSSFENLNGVFYVRDQINM